MPESRTTTQRLQLAAASFAGALALAFIAWRATTWALDNISIANQGQKTTVRVVSADATETTRFMSIDSVSIAILLVAGFAALLAIAALANAGYLAFRRED